MTIYSVSQNYHVIRYIVSMQNHKLTKLVPWIHMAYDVTMTLSHVSTKETDTNGVYMRSFLINFAQLAGRTRCISCV